MIHAFSLHISKLTTAVLGKHTCGTHFGCEKDPASMVSTPVPASLLTSSILVAAGILVFSFCSPSLGPTSIILTWSANAFLVLEKVRRDR